MNKIDARRKQILSLIYMIGLVLFYFVFDELGAKAGGYLSVVAVILLCIYLPFFAFLPVAIEKPLRARLSKGQIKNANGLWKVVLSYTFFVALALAIFMATYVPGFLVDVLKLQNIGFCLPYLAPAFFFLAISRALCMYFQGKGSGLQTVIAATLMILFSIVFSTILGRPFTEYGQKVADLLGNQAFREQYLLVGISLGIGVGAIITFIFLFFAYIISSKESGRNRHSIRLTEHTGDSFRIFIVSFFPYFFSTLMMLTPIILSFVMFFERNDDSNIAVLTLGKLVSKQYLPSSALLLGILSFVVLIVSQISSWVRLEEIRQARAGYRFGLFWILNSSVFITICFVILDMSLIGVLFLCLILAYFFATLLWQNGKRRSVLFSMFIAMVASMSCSFLLSGVLTKLEYVIFLPAIIQIGTLMICSFFFLVKHFRFVPDALQGFLFPILSSTISGVIMYVLGSVLDNLSKGLYGQALIIFIGFLCHVIISMVLQCGNDNEILNLPGGRLWLSIGNHLHLFH